MSLREYAKKRDFRKTTEPRGSVRGSRARRSFVVQKHAASRLHYDFRLEHDGVLKSWAVPKGPSLDPVDKRLAVEVEDHPLDYGSFEGTIPKGEYGAGAVIVWDRGRWLPEGDVGKGLRKGHLDFRLEGEKLKGGWKLVRMAARAGEDDRNWLLIKSRDGDARPSNGRALTERRPESVATGRTIEEIAGGTSRARKSAGRRPLQPARAKRSRSADLPTFVEPQLATLVDDAPTGDEWVHEIKYDGYRTLARVEGGRVRWFSRNGLDWTDRFAALSPAIEKLSAKSALLDGEIVVLRPDGTSSFQDLQKTLSEGRGDSLCYFAFDLLHLDGRDLRPDSLSERKKALHKLLGRKSVRLRYSDEVVGKGPAFHEAACKLGLEGIVSKKRDRPYTSGRTRDWLKTKCGLQQELVIAGFTAPQGSRAGLGALVLGVHDGGRLRHAGRVGTGFDRAMLLRLRRTLEPLRVESPPFDDAIPTAARRGVTWVRPELVADVRFTGWTTDGLLRHPTFQGLREDKAAAEVVRDRPAPPTVARNARTSDARAGSVRVAGIPITHPDRILYPGQGLTKLDLARYYERIAPRILPHVRGRPLSVLRCPRGQGQECFFQKHGHDTFPEEVGSVAIRESGGTAHYLTVDSKAGLVALVQMGVLELHPWGSRSDRLERPDRMFFDIDPGPGVPWSRVVECARLLRDLLEHLDLVSFLKTTGGKGLHVVVPLARKHGWEDVKSFSRAVAQHVAASQPKLYVSTAAKALRKGRIFIDYLRNGRGATAVAPFSTRARPGAPISTPLAWEELDRDVRSDTFHVGNLEQRLRRQRRDPWRGFSGNSQSLNARARAALGL